MVVKIKMTLKSDTVFGNGISVPGGEDIAVLCDKDGFPYYKGSTFKGIFREEFLRLQQWEGKTSVEAEKLADQWLGAPGADDSDAGKLIFSDFTIAPTVKAAVLGEIGNNPQHVTDAFTNLRTFTAMDEDGVIKNGSMRVARCVNQGITLHSQIRCSNKQRETVTEVLSLIKWLGSMRNRGFGSVELAVE